MASFAMELPSSEKKRKSASSSPQESLPPEKKQKLDSHDCSPSSNTNTGSSSSGSSSSEKGLVGSSSSEKELDNEDFDEDGIREMTDAEYSEYDRLIEDSDGFDVPRFPGVYSCCMITPLLFREVPEHILRYSKAAIADYNNKNGTDYKVVSVEKAMNQASCGIKYFITFQAVPEHSIDDAAQTFEGCVLMGIPEYEGHDATRVLLCRVQGDRTVSAIAGFDLDGDDEEM